MGSTKGLQDRMLEASLYVMTSFTECFPMVLLEAMACGLPVVSYDCPCGPRNIISHNEDGILIEDGNIEMLAKAIIKVIEDEDCRYEMGEKARQNVLRYSSSKVMQSGKIYLKNCRVSFVPLEHYVDLHVNILMLITIVMIAHTSGSVGSEYNSRLFLKAVTGFVLVSVILYMGLRPISGYYFGDMGTYARKYAILAKGGVLLEKDMGFTLFITACSRLISVELFFLLCVLLYVIPPYVAVRRWHKEHAIFALLAMIGSFSFWSYGTNGIRAGLASSFLFVLCRTVKYFP